MGRTKCESQKYASEVKTLMGMPVMMRSSGSQLTHDEKSQVFCADLMNLRDFAPTILLCKERGGTPTGSDS